MKRIVVKTMTYRTMNAVYAFAVGYAVTGKFAVAATMVGMEVAYKMVVYFAHEWAWTKVAFGAMKA